jgi:hypothetical protein
MGGQLRMGDSLGVWAFDRELRTGQLPLQHWRPEEAVTIASNINQFVGKQHYANGTRFNALQPQLNQVIRNSARLTVLVFCDGADEIKWTPYDDGINQVFQQRLAEQKRTRQPFVLVFRMQLGQYAGSTMNFPPGMVSVPEFPPLPAPPAPVKAPPPAPVVKPPPIGSPLIIIGTKVETNWPPPAPAMLTNPAPVTPIKAAPLIPTNIVPAAPTNPVTPPLPTNPAPVIQAVAAPAPPANAATPTNSPPVSLVSIPPSNPMTTTNPVAVLPENSGPNHKSALVIGGALLVAAGALVVLAVFRSRRSDRSSLISRAMRKD